MMMNIMKPRFKAAEEGNLSVLKALVTTQNVEERDKNSHSVLTLAVTNGHLSAARWLILCMGANVNSFTRGRLTCLRLAVRRGSHELVRLLLDLGADAALSDDNGLLPIHEACAQDEPECLAILLATHPEGAMATCDTRGFTPLHCAVIGASRQCCRMLLDAGVSVDVLDKKGRSPLFWTIQEAIFPMQVFPFRKRWVENNKDMLARLLICRDAQLENVKRDWIVWSIPQHLYDFFTKRRAAFAVLQLRCRKSGVIGCNGRDPLKLIARIIYWS